MTILNENGNLTSFNSEEWNCTIALQIPIVFSVKYFIPSIIEIMRGIKLMYQCFGGGRLWLEAGFCSNKEADEVWDLNVWIKSSMTQDDFEKLCHKVKQFANKMRHQLRQKAVVLEINNKMQLLF